MKFVKGRFDSKYVVPNISTYSVNARQYKTFDAQAIWMHSLIERRMWIHQTNKFHSCPDNVDSSLYRDGNVDTFTYLMP